MTVPDQATGQSWWAFAFTLPSDEAYPRVKVWRRLQEIGAVSFKKALYLLPQKPDTLEDLEWTLKEVTAAGGRGVIFSAQAVEGMGDRDLAELFNESRTQQYGELADEIRSLSGSLGRARTASPLEGADPLARFREQLASIEAIDFFQANGREQVQAQLRALEARLKAGKAKEQTIMTDETPALAPGRTWVTRANIHVDRMASAWLIKSRIDSAARFKFVTDRHYESLPGEVRFDMYSADYTHDADRCTYEVLLDLMEPPDAALRRIGEIVHDLDLRDRKFQHPETAGIKAMLDGVVANHENDADRIQRASLLFDDLYKSFSKGR